MPRTDGRRGRPPATKAEETRSRILRAARKVFSERGYDGATFQAIAVRAGLTRPAINHYFSSKRVLYREVVSQTAELLVRAGIEHAEQETTLTGRLTAFIAAAVRANSENPSASALLVSNILEVRRHPELSTPEADSVQMGREFLMRVVNEAIEQQEVIADVDVPALVETLVVLFCGVGLYVGYVRDYKEMLAVVDVLPELLQGAFWLPKQ